MGADADGLAADLLLALIMGAALGFGYDLLRPPRRSCGRAAAICLDALYCAAAGLLLFSFAMGAGSGRLGTWELAAALAGFVGYMHTLSDPVSRAFSLSWNKLLSALSFFEKKLKEALVFAKFYFQKLGKCFIIKK